MSAKPQANCISSHYKWYSWVALSLILLRLRNSIIDRSEQKEIVHNIVIRNPTERWIYSIRVKASQIAIKRWIVSVSQIFNGRLNFTSIGQVAIRTSSIHWHNLFSVIIIAKFTYKLQLKLWTTVRKPLVICSFELRVRQNKKSIRIDGDGKRKSTACPRYVRQSLIFYCLQLLSKWNNNIKCH